MPRYRSLALVLAATLSANASASEATFVRGDADANGTVQVSDGIRILSYLFGAEVPVHVTCLAALDADDSGSVGLTDAVHVLLFLFQGGPPPDEPFPGCGGDVTADALGCDDYEPCKDPRAEGGEVSGLDARPANGTCVAPPRPVARTSVALERAYPGLSLIGILGLYQLPGDSSAWYALRKPGYVYRFSNTDTATSKSTVLDISDRVKSTEEGGLLSLAFHPNFARNGFAYVFYTHEEGQLEGHLSRFTSRDGGLTLDPGSETILLTLPAQTIYHFGGTLAFGKDGYLYLGLGDGGLQREARDPSSLRGKILRIDVDSAQPYGIPPANPFARGGGRPEVYAWGFRNPFRWSFDRLTGELWAGDVGKDDWEEVDRVVQGGDHGWPILEGTHCYETPNCDVTGLIEPVADYSHVTDGSCVIGGYVYRGSRFSTLRGTYIFGDWGNGRIWGIPPGERTPALLVESGLRILGFAEGLDGELYVLSGDKIHRIVSGGAIDPPQGGTFPARLSETGFFEPGDVTRPRPCFIPYEVNAPFWSDGAQKDRWVLVPDGKTIHVQVDGDWEFPIGTVFIKQFRRGGEIFETRLLVRHEDGDWGAYTYEWNDAGTDADLLESEKTRDVGGSIWTFPNRAQCLQCHTEAAGRTLGPETAQLNRAITYPSTGRLANQLVTFEHVGLLDTPLPARPGELPALAAPADGARTLDDRARSYLHTNCSQCHRPDGGGRGSADLRFTTSGDALGICNAAPIAGDLDVSGARLLVPGEPELSLLSLRMHASQGKMPPIGRSLVDSVGASLIDEWIRARTDCGPAADEVILDNGSAGTSFTGGWSDSDAPNPYGASSIFSKGVGATYTFKIALQQPGEYDVQLWWTEWPSRVQDVPVDIAHSTGLETVNVDQRVNGGRWNSLGNFVFGIEATVTIHSPGVGTTCADAVRLVPRDARPGGIVLDSSQPGTLASGDWARSGAIRHFGESALYSRSAGSTYSFEVELPAAGDYEIYLWWPVGAEHATEVPVYLSGTNGTAIYTIDQSQGGGQWSLVATRSLGSAATITVHSIGGRATYADAVRLVPAPSR